MKALILSLVAALFLSNAMTATAAPKDKNAAYQIVKATENRVWRLNKQTGEVSVCSLDGERLLCSSSANAIEVPAQTYEERQAEKQRNLEEAKLRRQEQQKKDLAFLDRVMEAVRVLMGASMEREAQ